MEEWIQNIRKIKTESGLYEEGATPCVYEEDFWFHHDNYGNLIPQTFTGCEECNDIECQFRGAKYKDR